MHSETKSPEWLAPVGLYSIDRVEARPVRVPAAYDRDGVTETVAGIQYTAYHAAGFDGDGVPVLRHTVAGEGFAGTLHAHVDMAMAIRAAGGKWFHR